MNRWILMQHLNVITSYSIHYTKLYDISLLSRFSLIVSRYPLTIAIGVLSSCETLLTRSDFICSIFFLSEISCSTISIPWSDFLLCMGFRITSYNVCYTKLLRVLFSISSINTSGFSARMFHTARVFSSSRRIFLPVIIKNTGVTNIMASAIIPGVFMFSAKR